MKYENPIQKWCYNIQVMTFLKPDFLSFTYFVYPITARPARALGERLRNKFLSRFEVLA